MDDNENYYFCYDYYYDDVGDDDGRDFRSADFPGGRCWDPEPVVLQDSAGQVADRGLPVVEDCRGTGHLSYYIVS